MKKNMIFTRSLKTLFCASALLAAVGLASGAQAAEVGQCFTTAQLNETMKAEGQHSMAFGTQWLKDPKTGLRTLPAGHIFTSNDDGTLGYALEADAPVGQPFKEICVNLKLHNVKFFDTSIPGVPDEALIHGGRERALKFCEDKGFGLCNYHDDVLKLADKNLGERIMMLGRTNRGSLVTLTASLPGSAGGSLGITFPEGAYVSAGVFEDVKKTPTLIALYEKKKKTDSRQLRLQPRIAHQS